MKKAKRVRQVRVAAIRPRSASASRYLLAVVSLFEPMLELGVELPNSAFFRWSPFQAAVSRHDRCPEPIGRKTAQMTVDLGWTRLVLLITLPGFWT